jgi:hypothetical protein
MRFRFWPNTAQVIAALACSWVLALPALAGSIGFSINYTGDDISITNTGTEPAYQVSQWTLDAASQWRAVQVQQGNPAFLPPGKSLTGRRLTAAAATGLGRADPLLLLLHDQAGSRITQLAWRQTPMNVPQPLTTERLGRQLQVVGGKAGQAQTLLTYGIAVPYAGVAQLAQPLSATPAPPNPLRHVWANGPLMALDTGAGQSGAWLVHESATGDLQVQMVGDGKARGTEQVPGWLRWARQYLMSAAALLAGLGGLVLVAGLYRSARA